MKKSKLTGTVILVFVAILALELCYVGYKHNKDREYQENVSFARASLTTQHADLTKIEAALTALYLDKTQELLKTSVTNNDLLTISDQLSSIKVTAKDYGIQQADFPKQGKKLAKEKTAIEKAYQVAQKKLKIQTSINALFGKNTQPDWTTQNGEVAVVDNLASEKLSDLKEDIYLLPKGVWQNLASFYLTTATDQVKVISEVQASLSAMLKNEKITDKATWDTFNVLQGQIATIKNANAAKKANAALKTIYQQLYLATYGYSPEDSGTSSGTTDTTTTTADTNAVSDDTNSVSADTNTTNE